MGAGKSKSEAKTPTRRPRSNRSQITPSLEVESEGITNIVSETSRTVLSIVCQSCGHLGFPWCNDHKRVLDTPIPDGAKCSECDQYCSVENAKHWACPCRDGEFFFLWMSMQNFEEFPRGYPKVVDDAINVSVVLCTGCSDSAFLMKDDEFVNVRYVNEGVAVDIDQLEYPFLDVLCHHPGCVNRDVLCINMFLSKDEGVTTAKFIQNNSRRFDQLVPQDIPQDLIYIAKKGKLLQSAKANEDLMSKFNDTGYNTLMELQTYNQIHELIGIDNPEDLTPDAVVDCSFLLMQQSFDHKIRIKVNSSVKFLEEQVGIDIYRRIIELRESYVDLKSKYIVYNLDSLLETVNGISTDMEEYGIPMPDLKGELELLKEILTSMKSVNQIESGVPVSLANDPLILFMAMMINSGGMDPENLNDDLVGLLLALGLISQEKISPMKLLRILLK